MKLFTGSIDHSTDLKKLDALINELLDLKGRNFIIKDIDSWWLEFKIFIEQKWNISDWEKEIQHPYKSENNSQNFEYLISDFLHSEEGGKYKSEIIFNTTLICGEDAPHISASSSDITYRTFDGPKEHIPSVKYIEDLITSKNFSSDAFTNGRVYGMGN